MGEGTGGGCEKGSCEQQAKFALKEDGGVVRKHTCADHVEDFREPTDSVYRWTIDRGVGPVVRKADKQPVDAEAAKADSR